MRRAPQIFRIEEKISAKKWRDPESRTSIKLLFDDKIIHDFQILTTVTACNSSDMFLND
jgi:hypothetical protein